VPFGGRVAAATGGVGFETREALRRRRLCPSAAARGGDRWRRWLRAERLTGGGGGFGGSWAAARRQLKAWNRSTEAVAPTTTPWHNNLASFLSVQCSVCFLNNVLEWSWCFNNLLWTWMMYSNERVVYSYQLVMDQLVINNKALFCDFGASNYYPTC